MFSKLLEEYLIPWSWCLRPLKSASSPELCPRRFRRGLASTASLFTRPWRRLKLQVQLEEGQGKVSKNPCCHQGHQRSNPWGHMGRRACSKSHPNISTLRSAIAKAWASMLADYIRATCYQFRARIDIVIKNKWVHFEFFSTAKDKKYIQFDKLSYLLSAVSLVGILVIYYILLR